MDLSAALLLINYCAAADDEAFFIYLIVQSGGPQAGLCEWPVQRLVQILWNPSRECECLYYIVMLLYMDLVLSLF